MEEAQIKRHSFFSLDMDIDCRHVDVVDGIRGLSVLMVLWFHFWQQTWFMPNYPTPWLRFIGVTNLTPSHIRWVGYIFVDMMVLLSAFCLTLPLARSMLLGEPVDDACIFYKKRFARIYPSYLLAVLVSFGFQLWWGHYPTVSYAVRDLVSHLTFTHMFRADTYVYAPINGVLWTVGLEVQFYVLFPLLTRLFRKSPLLFWGTLTGFGALFIYQYALKQTPINMQVNQLPTFLPVFANGMLAAYLFTLYCVKAPYKRLWGVFFTALAVAREPVPGLDAYMSDFKKIITFNRSNGGATYLADGEIICKWPLRKLPDAEELSKVASRNPMEQLVGRSSRRRIAFQGVVLYSLALLLIL